MSDDLPKWLAQLRSGDLEAAIKASVELIKIGSTAVEPLIEIVGDDKLYPLWWLAAQALGSIGDKRAVQPLIALLKNPVSFDALMARKYAAYALANLSDPRALDALIELLHERWLEEEEEDDGTISMFDEPDHETIEAAAGGLARIGQWRGIKAVIDRLLEGDTWHDHGMGEWGGEQAYQYIVAALPSNDLERRSRAVTLLGEFRDKRATPLLVELLKTDPSDPVRHSAAYGLSELRDPRGFSPLLLALRDPYTQVRLYAAIGVSCFLNPGLYRPETNELDSETLLRDTLGEIGENAALGILIDAVKDLYPAIRRYAVQFLAAFLPFLSQSAVQTQIRPQLEELTSIRETDIQTAVQKILLRLSKTGSE